MGGTALEIGIMTRKGSLGTFQFGGCYRYTHIWCKTADGLKVRASQLTPILRDSGILDPRGQLLRAAVGFAGCSMLSYWPPPLPQSKKSTWTRYDAAGTACVLK
jgi:hypothetical protein